MSVPTIRDVAERAGVAPMTVSRVLSGGKNVRPEKMDAVLRAVDELGYRKNENARSLRPGQRTGLVGVIITNVGNPYYADLQLGVEEILSTRGIRLLVGNSGEDPARERQLIADFVGRQVDGLILVPSHGATPEALAATLNEVPVVLASRLVPGWDVDTVVLDDVAGAYEGTRRLVSEGHTRIAYVGNLTSMFTGGRRLQGYRQALHEAGIEVDETLVRAGQQDPKAAEFAMCDLLDLPDPPTAVFSANNRNTVGVLRALGQRSREQNDPQLMNTRVVGFDDFELSDLMPFPLSVIAHDPRELGRAAARLLTHRLDGEALTPQMIHLPVELSDR